MVLRVSFVALALLFSTSLSIADHAHVNKKASQAYNSGDYATAFEIWRVEAEKGDVIAQGKVGAMYAHGKGTQQNFVEAAKWYRMAAEQGYLNAQFSLGRMYFLGLGVTQSDEYAYAWWSIAATKGNEVAQVKAKELQKKMPPYQIEKAQNLARAIWAKTGLEKVPLEFPSNKA